MYGIVPEMPWLDSKTGSSHARTLFLWMYVAGSCLRTSLCTCVAGSLYLRAVVEAGAVVLRLTCGNLLLVCVEQKT